jgi:hypothetical protein
MKSESLADTNQNVNYRCLSFRSKLLKRALPGEQMNEYRDARYHSEDNRITVDVCSSGGKNYLYRNLKGLRAFGAWETPEGIRVRRSPHERTVINSLTGS